jgi:hypothetical protein
MHEAVVPDPQQALGLAHAGFEPHSHAPFVHELEPVHATQLTPFVPHCDSDCCEAGKHEPLAQQLLGHVFGSHAQVPLVVSHSPLAQAAQVTPLEPQDVADCEV